jgi:hypothetical protein
VLLLLRTHARYLRRRTRPHARRCAPGRLRARGARAAPRANTLLGARPLFAKLPAERMAHAGAAAAAAEEQDEDVWVAVSSETVERWREEAWAQKEDENDVLCVAGVADMSVSECGTANMSGCSRRVAPHARPAPRGAASGARRAAHTG